MIISKGKQNSWRRLCKFHAVHKFHMTSPVIESCPPWWEAENERCAHVYIPGTLFHTGRYTNLLNEDNTIPDP
jgi:hypothetical protein